MEDQILQAETRSDFGKNKSRQLRSQGFIPAVLYSHGNTESIKVVEKSFKSLFKGHISESKIFNIDIQGNTDQMAFVKSFQKNPITDEIIHLDLFKVTKGEKINTVVPIELTGSPKGVKMGGILEIGEREIEVECLPKDLPETITVDISNIDIEESIHAKDLELGDTIKILSNPETVIAAVHVTRAGAEAEEEETEGAEEAAPTESESSNE